eukprot:TRINITY_DN8987_c0_g1_i1.p1 TRINITY_DN8987_c0_g1~~TRINITY_DN8987_c0_g1_i1.p1  ORF type:complete len:1280 (+),score=335.03 TRINITY_DN8987_c0_g1_i1:34-3840(+)
MTELPKVKFSIDRGGTFTDIYAQVPQEPGYIVMKLLSEDPQNYRDAPTEGIRRILQSTYGVDIPRNVKVPSQNIEYIRMGTTVATNALLERTGRKCALITTEGFKDLLQIGNQSRPHIFDLVIKKPELLYSTVVEVPERILWSPDKPEASPEYTIEKGLSGWVKVLQKPNIDAIRPQLQNIIDSGIDNVAIVFIHSYAYQKHENMVGDLCEELGFKQISKSGSLMPKVKAVPRGQTAMVDAYLNPLITDYIDGFISGFDEYFTENVDLTFMMSDGGLCPVDSFNGYRAILSGPAGGVVGYAETCYYSQEGEKKPVIGIDMGGTSTDVSRFDGEYDHIFETEIAGVFIQAPQLNIQTVAAGGGSLLLQRPSGSLDVGPESAGAHPGPVCYGKNGKRAVTDVNVLLGRINPDYFPHIFGADENQPLNLEASKENFSKFSETVNEYLENKYEEELEKGLDAKLIEYSEDELAYGLYQIAITKMCRPIRNLTTAKGFEVSNHILSVFGGAGPQHACAVARSLGMSEVYIHKFSSILSAYGLSMADVVFENSVPYSKIYSEDLIPSIEEHIEELSSEYVDKLRQKGYEDENIQVLKFVNLRFSGTNTSIMVRQRDGLGFDAQFKEIYMREYGFIMEDRDIITDDIRVRVIGKSKSVSDIQIQESIGVPQPKEFSIVYFPSTGRTNTPLYILSDLGAGDIIKGPAILVNETTSIVVEPQCDAHITVNGDVRIFIGDVQTKVSDTTFDAILLSVFSNRFMGIAEEMGKTLQRTSISTNIKERLDFSCAIFDTEGRLVANAPHLPVHLGAMQEAVKWQIQHWGDSWNEGEVLMSNHPAAGGSHLPDITVITPVYTNGKPVFYLANRGHHADIGGISPGSMPPFSRELVEEGAAIKSFKLVENGVFQEDGVSDLLMSPGLVEREQFEKPLYGTRNLTDNLADLKAQVASNKKGIGLIQDLIEDYGLDVVLAYMTYVQENARDAVKKMLFDISLKHGLEELDVLSSKDYMDNGAKIELNIYINRKECTAIFDFTGTDPEIYGNINAPKAVTYSAIIYCLRCLVSDEIPLNQGCMDPITVIIPKGSLLDPSDTAAVVGGNVLTSQRVTDIILHAFGAAANSQGCMNNFTFGDKTGGYYETIAGGAGAGPTWEGQSAVQTHMTNTRITDVEILERRYPVLLTQFSIRTNSGGKGSCNGGDGAIREVMFLKDGMNVGILSERRALEPKGINGGENGQRGKNIVIKRDGRVITLGPKNEITLNKGDRIQICTPGGGGYGINE